METTRESYEFQQEQMRYIGDLIDGSVRTSMCAKNLDPDDRKARDLQVFTSWDIRYAVALAINLAVERNPEMVDLMKRLVLEKASDAG